MTGVCDAVGACSRGSDGESAERKKLREYLFCHIWSKLTMVKNPLINSRVPIRIILQEDQDMGILVLVQNKQGKRNNRFWVMCADRQTQRYTDRQTDKHTNIPKCSPSALTHGSEGN